MKTERLLGRRLITALILMPLALLCIWVGGRLYAALIAAMTIFLVFEWTRMVDGAELRRAFYVLSATAAGATFFAASGEPAAALLLTALGGFLGTLFAWPRPSPTSW
ncbi:MAG: phosphatidate cytidylyltransferase, partial [Pseudomonadota bacterium]